MTSFANKNLPVRLIRTGLFSSIAIALTTAPIIASAYSFSSGNVDMTIGGFAKLSAIYSETDSGKISDQFGYFGRHIYLPSSTPVNSGADENHQVFDMTARESRINFKGTTEQDGHNMGMVLEIDFLNTTNGSEVVSNSSSPRLRHFFFTFDNWLFGQTWSTFMDTSALAESVDFLASPEGIVFIRQAQVRYTAGAFQIALENPENFISGTTDRDVSMAPDLTANYKMKGDWGHMRLNGLVRQLAVTEDATNTASAIDESTSAYGIGISGKIKLGADDIRFSVNYGDGMGRYTSLGMVKDAILTSNGKIETVKSTAASAAYRHVWNGKSSSNLILSMIDISNPDAANGTENKKGSSVQINYLFRPVKQVSYGIMYLTGERETVNGNSGKLNRIQASAKYSF